MYEQIRKSKDNSNTGNTIEKYNTGLNILVYTCKPRHKERPGLLKTVNMNKVHRKGQRLLHFMINPRVNLLNNVKSIYRYIQCLTFTAKMWLSWLFFIKKKYQCRCII